MRSNYSEEKRYFGFRAMEMTMTYNGPANIAVREQKCCFNRMQIWAVDNVVDWFRVWRVKWYHPLGLLKGGTLSPGRLWPLDDFLNFDWRAGGHVGSVHSA
jgi:hypothetical protein